VRALVFGSRGLVGRALVRALRRRGAPVLGLGHAEADVTDAAAVTDWARRFRPEWIFNGAAFAAVDACESEPALAFAVNAAAVGNLTSAAAEIGAGLVHFSTDYVFDGVASAPYAEDAPPQPLSVYGASKLAGEERALAYGRALVVRSSWIFGEGGANFVDTLLRRMAAGETTLRVVGDQRGAPTYAPALAHAALALAAGGERGLVHYRGREPVSWYEFARAIAAEWDPAIAVERVASSEFPRPAKRPAYSVLDVTRCERLLGRRVEAWSCGLAAHLERRRANPRRSG